MGVPHFKFVFFVCVSFWGVEMQAAASRESKELQQAQSELVEERRARQEEAEAKFEVEKQAADLRSEGERLQVSTLW